jgi:hypothetical protein
MDGIRHRIQSRNALFFLPVRRLDHLSTLVAAAAIFPGIWHAVWVGVYCSISNLTDAKSFPTFPARLPECIRAQGGGKKAGDGSWLGRMIMGGTVREIECAYKIRFCRAYAKPLGAEFP